MKLILLALSLTVLGCGTKTTDVSNSYSLPSGISDCKIYELENGYGGRILLARCPLSETAVAYSTGKTTKYSTTIEVDTNGLGEYRRLKEKFETKN